MKTIAFANCMIVRGLRIQELRKKNDLALPKKKSHVLSIKAESSANYLMGVILSQYSVG